MITDPTPPPGQAAPPAGSKRSPWLWVSLALALVAIVLLVWALSTKSDLDSTQTDLEKANQQVQQLQANTGKNTVLGGALMQAAKGAYNELAQELGATTEDLAATQQELKTAEQTAAQADQTAAAAKQTADEAKSATDKAKATADQLTAQAQAATAKATVAADCAKVSVSTLGQLFEGDSVRAQAQTVKTQLQDIAAQCKAALGG
jgi:methyl-accepting chemotaxis protein